MTLVTVIAEIDQRALDQHDRGFESNGLKCFIERLAAQGSDRIKMVQFDKGDVERHPIVAEVLKLYGDS